MRDVCFSCVFLFSQVGVCCFIRYALCSCVVSGVWLRISRKFGAVKVFYRDGG